MKAEGMIAPSDLQIKTEETSTCNQHTQANEDISQLGTGHTAYVTSEMDDKDSLLGHTCATNAEAQGLLEGWN